MRGNCVNVRSGGPTTVGLFRRGATGSSHVRVIPLTGGCPRNNRGRLISTMVHHRIPTPPTVPIGIKTVIRGMNATFTICRTIVGGGPLFRHCAAIANGRIGGPNGFLMHVNAPFSRVVRGYNNLPRNSGGMLTNNPVVNGTMVDLSIPMAGNAGSVAMLASTSTRHGGTRPYVHYTGYISTYPVNLRPCLLTALDMIGSCRHLRTRRMASYVTYNSYRFAYPSRHPVLSGVVGNGTTIVNVVETHDTGGWTFASEVGFVWREVWGVG